MRPARPVPERPTIRQRSRAQVRREAKQAALGQLEQSGPAGLSVSAIGKELGVSGPALYRYFASRDELLTELIIDAYDDQAQVLRAGPSSLPGEWRTTLTSAQRPPCAQYSSGAACTAWWAWKSPGTSPPHPRRHLRRGRLPDPNRQRPPGHGYAPQPRYLNPQTQRRQQHRSSLPPAQP
jgi:AcrR family transcriptional regulator